MTCQLYFRCKAAFALPIAYPNLAEGSAKIFRILEGATDSQAGFRLNLETLQGMFF